MNRFGWVVVVILLVMPALGSDMIAQEGWSDLRPWWQRPPYSMPFDPSYQTSDLVCIAELVDRFTSGSSEAGPYGVAPNVYFRAKILRVLKGDKKAGHVISIFTGQGWKVYVPERSEYCLYGLKQVPEGFYVAATSQRKVSPEALAIQFPADLSARDQALLLLLATVQTADSSYAGGLVGYIAQDYPGGFDSAGLDLRESLLRIQEKRPQLKSYVIWARIRLGDASALSDLIEFYRPLGRCSEDQFRGLDSDDAVTTLNLILEGERWPWMKGARLGAALRLRELAHPSSLPYFIRALDDPDPRIQYYSYTGIEAVRGDKPVTPASIFLSGSFSPNKPVTASGRTQIEQIKQWWEAEGKRQFDYVLPKDK